MILFARRYQVQYDVSDSNGVSATSLILNITFVESAIVTGSLLFLARAANGSAAQKIAVDLFNTSSVVNAAFTATVASVFQSWLADTTAAYVTQYTSSQETDAALVHATNTVRLALFSNVTQPDVQVLSSAIDPNVTALLVNNSTAEVQNYAYNVTLQITVLTANLLSSVFVDVLNSTSSRRLLLAAASTLDASQLDQWHSPPSATSSPQSSAAHHVSTPAAQMLSGSNDKFTGNSDGSIGNRAHLYNSSCSSNKTASNIGMYNSSDSRTRRKNRYPHGTDNATDIYSSSTSSRTGCTASLNHCMYSSSVVNHSLYSSSSKSSSSHMGGLWTPSFGSTYNQDTQSRRLLASQSTSAFPLASLLMFKMGLTLAALQGTSGCSPDNIADLFYAGAAAPGALSQLCGSSDSNFSLSQALLAVANSSMPLLQVHKYCCFILPICNASMIKHLGSNVVGHCF